ncbi:hypothetical protein LINPERHAP2_LOCUS384 [Linum perenne]
MSLQPILYNSSHMCLAWRHISSLGAFPSCLFEKSRNHVIFNATQFLPHVMFCPFSHHVAEFPLVQHHSLISSSSTPLEVSIPTRWIPPIRDSLKISVDGAVRQGWEEVRDGCYEILLGLFLTLLRLRIQVDIEGDAEQTFSYLSAARV